MEPDAHDQKLIELLAKVKEADPEYPQHLLAARREQYLRQLGQASLGVAVGMIAKQSLVSAKASAGTTLTSKLIEATLVIAIAAEAGAVAYLSRDRLANFIRTLTTSERGPEIITSPGATDSLIPENASPTPGMTATVSFSATPEIVVTSTPVLSLLDATESVNTTTVTEIDSTPTPNGDNGHHYGQTPKPERTKENGGNDDKPPQSPKPTKKPKPTKTK